MGRNLTKETVCPETSLAAVTYVCSRTASAGGISYGDKIAKDPGACRLSTLGVGLRMTTGARVSSPRLLGAVSGGPLVSSRSRIASAPLECPSAVGGRDCAVYVRSGESSACHRTAFPASSRLWSFFAGLRASPTEVWPRVCTTRVERFRKVQWGPQVSGGWCPPQCPGPKGALV